MSLSRIFFTPVRFVLGFFILAYERLASPRWPERSPEAQARIDARARELALYQFKTCPFCVKVRMAMRRLGVDIELRDTQRDPARKAELLSGGGNDQVPCLRIPKPEGGYQWLYESSDIIAWLEKRFV